MQRDTFKKTIGRYEVEIKSYATPREINAVRALGLKENETNTSKQEEVMIQQLVVSVNDSSEKVADFVLDNFDFGSEYVPLMETLGEVISKKK